MPAPGERSGERRLPNPPSVRRLWPPRRPASRAARPAVRVAGAPGVHRPALPGALQAPGAGGSPLLLGFLRRGFETQPPPHRLHLPSSSRETKGLFIKRIVGGSSGGGGGREGGIYKDKKRWSGGRSCAASGSPERRRRPGSPSGSEADTTRPVGTREAARACGGLGCPAAMLPSGLPQSGNGIARPRGPGRRGRRDPRGGLPRETRALFPTNSFEIAQARGDFASLFQRGRLSYARLARPHNVPELALPSCAPACAHTPTHTRGVPLGRTQLQKRGGAKPLARSASVCSGSDDFRAVFCKLILLVSAQSKFNHGSKSDRMASFPSGFGHAASGRSPAEPTGREKYLAALRGASRPPSLAPGAGLRCRSKAWELGARGRRELRAGAQSGLPRAASSARGCSPEENLAGEGAKGGGLGARTLHTPARWRQTGYGWGWGKSCAQRPLPTGPSSGSRYAKAAASLASGLRAARGAPGQKREPPGSPARPGEPSWPAPLCLPSSVLDCPCPIPDARRAPGCRHRPQSRAMRAALSLAQPVREGGDHAQRQVGRVLGANFGVPRLSVSQGPRFSATGTTSAGHKCSPAPPEQSDLPRPPSALPCCGAPAAAAGAVPEGRAATGAGSLASGARRAARPGCRSPLASGRCPRAHPPPAASARSQVHAGGAAAAASICSLHSHRPAPRRAPGRDRPRAAAGPPPPRPGRVLTFRGRLRAEERRSHGRRVCPLAPAQTAKATRCDGSGDQGSQVRTLSVPPAEEPGRASQSPSSQASGRRSPRGSWAGLASRSAGLSRGRHLRLLQEHGFLVSCPAASRSAPSSLSARAPRPLAPLPVSPGAGPRPSSGVPNRAAFPNLHFPGGGRERAQLADAASGPTAAAPSAAPERAPGSRLHL
ncbi:collagen alpha-2(I) chain-like [Kogia breviceps]|uniref:collagen alpha-2(I) chain-like n=1 Tax=Kogia breviceps TaxID=27615 RepID=UPI0034D2B60B